MLVTQRPENKTPKIFCREVLVTHPSNSPAMIPSSKPEILSEYKEVQIVDSASAANSLLKDGWRLLTVGVDVQRRRTEFSYMLGRKAEDPLEESKRIVAELKTAILLRRSAEWDTKGEPEGKIKLSRALGRLVAGLRPGREIRIGLGKHGITLRVFNDGALAEGYAQPLNDLPQPAEPLID